MSPSNTTEPLVLQTYHVHAVCTPLPCEPLQTSVVSLGNTKQPLPGFQRRSSLLAARHGELNSNVDLAAGMPEVRRGCGG